jgi:hypothetical protein
MTKRANKSPDDGKKISVEKYVCFTRRRKWLFIRIGAYKHLTLQELLNVRSKADKDRSDGLPAINDRPSFRTGSEIIPGQLQSASIRGIVPLNATMAIKRNL